GASGVGRDLERLRKRSVVVRGACRAQTRELQQGLEYLWDLNPADISAEASMLPGSEVQVMVVGPIGPEFLRRVQHARVEHGRPGQREDGRALADQRLMPLARSEMVVFLGHPDDHWIDRLEAECLEDQCRQRIVVVGLGCGRGAGQHIGPGKQHQQRLDRRLGGRLHHADDQPHQCSAYAVIVEACDSARTLQPQQPAHDIVPALNVRGAALRQKHVETLAHLGARRDGRGPDHGVVQEVDEELSEAGPGPGHHLLIVRGKNPKYSSANRTGTFRVSVWTMSTGPLPWNSSLTTAPAWRETMSFTRGRSSRRTTRRMTEIS